jgi:hypothetical protein
MLVPGHVLSAPLPAPQLSSAERRRADRYDLRLRILLREDRFATAGYTVNISASGAFVRTSAPLRLGARYHFSVELPDRVDHTQVKVLRELPDYMYAVEFENSVRIYDR